jgi:hypothetical protein
MEQRGEIEYDAPQLKMTQQQKQRLYHQQQLQQVQYKMEQVQKQLAQKKEKPVKHIWLDGTYRMEQLQVRRNCGRH